LNGEGAGVAAHTGWPQGITQEAETAKIEAPGCPYARLMKRRRSRPSGNQPRIHFLPAAVPKLIYLIDYLIWNPEAQVFHNVDLRNGNDFDPVLHPQDVSLKDNSSSADYFMSLL
jgi:hypothetical protein